MFRNVRDWIKTRPHLYDIMKRTKRQIFPESDPIFEFFDEFSKSRNRKVSFIQIGASDGLRNDPIREFVIRDRWSGIFVEPLPAVFELLKANYAYSKNPNLVFVNAAISSSDLDTVSFWTFDDAALTNLPLEDRLNYLRKASFDKKHVGRARDSIQSTDKILKEIKVRSLTFDSLVKEYWSGGGIDLLVCDAEGHEAVIITSIDFARVRPGAIFFESHNLGPDKSTVYDLLDHHGYDITEFVGDSVAVHKTCV